MDKTFDAAEAEPRIYAAWEAAGAFAAGANASRDETFCVMIPPPNVTGSLHMGHAFNNTLQDILVRWHRMRGFDTLWQPGQDHAGIATQNVVERQLEAEGLRRTDFSREAFVDKVWEWKRHSGGRIIDQLKRLGASCDWSRNAFTMSGAPGAPEGEEGNFHDAVIRAFVQMYEAGWIYRGKRLVNWDPHFETAISDLEVEQVEVEGRMWHFRYPLEGGQTYTYRETDEDGNVTLEEERDYISIATTRPETMLGDGAVAVHPSDERYAPIVGKLCEIPVGPKESRRLIPIITDEYPDPDFGSGAVKITGAHDFNDYAVAARAGIPMYRLMDARGAMRADGPPYAEEAAKARRIAQGADFDAAEIDTMNLVPEAYRGLDRFAAREKIVADITAEGLAMMVPAWDERLGRSAARPIAPEEGGDEAPEQDLVPLVEPNRMVQPTGDRSKTVIEPMLTDQWFVDSQKIVQPAIDAVREGLAREGATDGGGKPAGTAILPEQDAKVYFNWLADIEPWCISRQLWWGHRIPVWYGPDFIEGDPKRYRGEQQFCAVNEDQAIALAKKAYGDDVTIRFWHERPANNDEAYTLWGFTTVGSDKTGRVKLSAVELWRDPDVLDTWFSSGIWPIATLGWPRDTDELRRYFPTDVLITGFDIIFFWVARMMMMQYALTGERPFHTVYVHPLVRDAKGKKMSKSLGNVLDPLELIEDYGADAVRFTLAAMAAMGRDLKLSTERVAGYRNFVTKLWNAARFAEMNDCRPQPGFDPAGVSETANRWIVAETAAAREATDAALAAYRFNDAANGLYAFVWGRVCDWYLEFAKPLLASDEPEIAAETRATLAWVLDQCLILLHPFMPFVTEELWGAMAERQGMLVHTDWPEYEASDFSDSGAAREMGWVIALIEEIRSARAQIGVPAGRRVPVLEIALDEAGRTALSTNEELIRRLARVESFARAEAAPRGAVTVTVPGATFALPLADVVDVAEEKARLEKLLGKLEGELDGLRGRLDNPKFVESAPDEVVAQTRERLEQGETEAGKLRAALARLAEAA